MIPTSEPGEPWEPPFTDKTDEGEAATGPRGAGPRVGEQRVPLLAGPPWGVGANPSGECGQGGFSCTGSSPGGWLVTGLVLQDLRDSCQEMLLEVCMGLDRRHVPGIPLWLGWNVSSSLLSFTCV